MSVADGPWLELYQVMGSEVGLVEKMPRALDLGVASLEVENGHVARVDPALEYWQAVASTDRGDGAFPTGLTLDLGETYCRRTIAEGQVTLHDAGSQGWTDDVAFRRYELSCYRGTPVTIDEEVYATVCFVSRNPRERPFDE